MVMETFRDLLDELARARACIERSREQILLAVSNCCTMTTNYDKVGRGGGGGDARDGPLAALGDLMDAHRELWSEYRELKVMLLRLLRTLRERGCKREEKILLYRYNDDLEWDDVMFMLAEDGIAPGSMRTLFRWHRGALEQADKIWEGLMKHDDNGNHG